MKKIIALLLAIILVFAFASCGNTSDVPDDGDNANNGNGADVLPNYPLGDIFEDEDGNQNLPIIPAN